MINEHSGWVFLVRGGHGPPSEMLFDLDLPRRVLVS